jgi:hypothetical protein
MDSISDDCGRTEGWGGRGNVREVCPGNMANSLDRLFVLVYDLAMRSDLGQAPAIADTYVDVVTGEVLSVDGDIDARFQAIVAEHAWFEAVRQVPPDERVDKLLAAPVGIDLMSELRLIDPNQLDSGQRLTYTHLWERCVAWVNDQAAASAAGFIDAIENPPENRMYTRFGHDVADEVCLDEVAIATGLSQNKAAMRILAGHLLAPSGVLADTGAALRAGRISWEVAVAFVDATFHLDDHIATAVQDRVLPRAIAVIDPDTGEGCWRDRSWAVRELRRALIAVDPDTIAKQRDRATAGRYVDLTFDFTSGTAYLTACLPAHQAMEIYDTLIALATRLRSDDETTNPDQRPRGWNAAMADALVETIRAAGQHLTDTGNLPSVQGKTRIDVGVIIDLPTLLGLADHPGEIRGYGPIDPHYARLLAAQADTWRRWVIEPVTGHLLDLGRTRYKPNQELRDSILAAYPKCSVPECDRHPHGLQVDHAIEWADDGPTSAANLHALCWADHQRKTNGDTRVTLNPDGTTTHTTRHGLTRSGESHWRSFAENLNLDRTVETDGEIPPF